MCYIGLAATYIETSSVVARVTRLPATCRTVVCRLLSDKGKWLESKTRCNDGGVDPDVRIYRITIVLSTEYDVLGISSSIYSLA